MPLTPTEKYLKGYPLIKFMEKTICECGFEVNGVSQRHVESNLTQHKKSKLHKKLMKAKQRESSAPLPSNKQRASSSLIKVRRKK